MNSSFIRLNGPDPISRTTNPARAGDTLTRSNHRLALWPVVSFCCALMACGGGGDPETPRTPAAPVQWHEEEVLQDRLDRASQAKVAVDATGNGIAVWSQPSLDGATHGLRFRRYSRSSGWSAITPVSTPGDAFGAQVALNGAGDAMLVWQQVEPSRSRTQVWAMLVPRGSSPQAPVLLDDRSGRDVQVAWDDGGNAIAVWAQVEGDVDRRILAAHFSGGAWQTRHALLDRPGATGRSTSPRLVMNARGDAVVVWTRSSGAEGAPTDIWSNRYVPGAPGTSARWGTAELLETRDGTADDPAVAIDPLGRAVAVWTQQATPTQPRHDTWGIIGTREGWGPAQLVEHDDRGSAQKATVAIDGTGNATAVWRLDLDPTRGSEMRTARNLKATSWANEERLDSSGAAGSALMGIDGLGRPLVVWSDRSGDTDRRIRSRRLAKSGTWESVEPVARLTAGDPESMSLATAQGGESLLVWILIPQNGVASELRGSATR
jgi:hypothetical protein